MPTRLDRPSFPFLQAVIQIAGSGQTGIRETLNINGLKTTNVEVSLGTQRAEQGHHQ